MRLQINITEEMNEKLGYYAKRFGVKKKDIANVFIMRGIEYFENLCNPNFIEFYKILTRR